jgi:hypothetical protein
VIHLAQMRDFMRGQIVQDIRRGEDQPPGIGQCAGSRAGTPAGARVADRAAGVAHAEARRLAARGLRGRAAREPTAVTLADRNAVEIEHARQLRLELLADPWCVVAERTVDDALVRPERHDQLDGLARLPNCADTLRAR